MSVVELVPVGRNRLYERHAGSREVNSRAEQMHLPGTGERNFYRPGDIFFQREFTKFQMASQFVEFRGQLYDNEFTVIDLIRAVLDMSNYQVLCTFKTIDNASHRYCLQYELLFGGDHRVLLTPRSGACHSLRWFESRLPHMRMARTMEVWETVGRIVLEGSTSVFGGASRALTRAVVRGVTRRLRKRVMGRIVLGVRVQIRRRILRWSRDKFASFIAAVSLNVAVKVAELIFMADMQNEFLDNNPQLNVRRREILAEVNQAIPELIRNAAADELADMLVEPLAECLNTEDRRSVELLAAPLNQLFMDKLAAGLVAGLSSILREIARAFIVETIAVRHGETKQRFERRVGTQLNASIAEQMSADRFAQAVEGGADAFFGSLATFTSRD